LVLSVNQTILIAVPGKKEKQPLSVTHPELAKEADGWDPSSITANSHKKLQWRCSLGHSFSIRVDKRTQRGNGCQYCSGKKVLKSFNDLATNHPAIAKEADGWDPTTVTEGIRKKLPWLCPQGHRYLAQVSNRTSSLKTGCPICSGRKVLSGFNDLASEFPEIAIEADGWDPSAISPGANAIKQWRCLKGHSFMTAPKSRTTHNQGCPYCANQKILKGFNDLATTHPLLAKQALGWDPTTVVAGSGKKVMWLCESEHKFSARLNQRSTGGSLKTGTECPTCAKYGFDPNASAFLYFLFHSGWDMHQIGITNEIDRRIKEHIKNKWELIEFRGPMDGYLAKQLETAILRMLKAKGADLSNSKIAGKFDGYSEAWSRSTFEVKSIKELMKLTEEFEDKS